MADILQPVHLVFIIVIVIILLGPGKPSELGRGLARGISGLRKGSLFMAKGVDPGVGRDVGDMLPDEEVQRSRILLRMMLAILLGNLFYFASWPLLPSIARLDSQSTSALPVLVEIWFCVLAYGVLRLFRPRPNPRP